MKHIEPRESIGIIMITYAFEVSMSLLESFPSI